MKEEIQQVANLLMYDGPRATELVRNAVENGHKFTITNRGEITIVTIESVVAYNLKVIDVYDYNMEGQLIKQVIIMNGKEQIVFDKYSEATQILTRLQKSRKMVS
jgi:hypothetical protein